MNVRYVAPPHHKLEAYGKTIAGGDTVEFTDEQLRRLAMQGVKFREVPSIPGPKDRPSLRGSRRQWAQHAKARGVIVTDDMSRDDLITAAAEAA